MNGASRVVGWGHRIQAILDQHLLLVLLSVGLLAYATPRGPVLDSFLSSKAYLPYVFVLAMLSIGSVLPADEVRQTFAAWPSVVYGTLMQYTIMPALAFGLGYLLPLEPDLKVGLIICGCVPGAMASNVVTLMARGNVSYSVSVTSISTLLSPVVVPTAFGLLLGATVQTNPLDTSWKLLWQVVLPVLAGFLLSRWSPHYSTLMRGWGPVLANAAILWIVGFVVAENRDYLVQSPPVLFAGLMALNLLGYVGGYLAGLLGGLDQGKIRALAIEVGMQNAGLGTVLALQLFPDRPAICVPTALYTFGCVLTGTILAWFWSQGTVVRRVSLIDEG